MIPPGTDNAKQCTCVFKCDPLIEHHARGWVSGGDRTIAVLSQVMSMCGTHLGDIGKPQDTASEGVKRYLGSHCRSPRPL